MMSLPVCLRVPCVCLRVQAVSKADNVNTILRTLTHHPDAPTLAAACRALGDALHEETGRASEALHAVLAVMAAHRSDAHLQRNACWALTQLLPRTRLAGGAAAGLASAAEVRAALEAAAGARTQSVQDDRLDPLDVVALRMFEAQVEHVVAGTLAELPK